MELFQSTAEGAQQPSFDEDEPPPTREFHMTADVSKADLLGRIRRQKYYWDYEVKKRSFSQEELAKRVPVEALSDTEVEPGQIPQRVVNRKMMEVSQNQTLRQLWDEGRRPREGQETRRQNRINARARGNGPNGASQQYGGSEWLKEINR